MSKNKFKYTLDDGTLVELPFSEIKKIINSKNSDIDFKECEKAFEFLLNKENEDIIKEKQEREKEKQELIKRLINDIYIISNKRKKEEEKLEKIRPINIGMASRISGVSPADISVLLIYLKTEKNK